MISRIISLVAVCSVVGYLYAVVKLIYDSWVLRKFPGPIPLPLVGNGYHPMFFKNFFTYLARLVRKHGKIFKFFGVNRGFIVVADGVVARKILVDSAQFPKGHDYTYFFAAIFGEGLVTSSGDKHKKDRALFNKYFIKSNIIKQTAKVNALTDELIESDLVTDKVVNIEEFFAKLSLRVFMNFSLGLDFSDAPELEHKVVTLSSSGSRAVTISSLLSLPMNWMNPWMKSIQEARNTFIPMMPSYIEGRLKQRKEGTAPETEDCLDCFINKEMSLDEYCDHMITLVAAGHDTTAYFNSYMAYLLATHPEVQQRLLDEINRVLGDRDEVTADDYTNCKYASQVMREVLRLYPVIPRVTREAAKTVTLQDSKDRNITFPAGSTVMIAYHLIFRDPDVWEKPNEFYPEHFDPDSLDFTSANQGYFPFSYGTRSCIGGYLAQFESFIFLSRVLRKFKLEPAPGYKPKVMAGISLTTLNGVDVILRKR